MENVSYTDLYQIEDHRWRTLLPTTSTGCLSRYPLREALSAWLLRNVVTTQLKRYNARWCLGNANPSVDKYFPIFRFHWVKKRLKTKEPMSEKDQWGGVTGNDQSLDKGRRVAEIDQSLDKGRERRRIEKNIKFFFSLDMKRKAHVSKGAYFTSYIIW